ncbi:MAG: Cell elongation specific D,D-transpeptidase [candidate division CPR2 bacterium GW2011_GWD1_39_7]|nr:MAG: Cell elongation specific D,D-transpeptidase [candidate division CPR2 bacterium GW2011_GWD1_39_7]
MKKTRKLGFAFPDQMLKVTGPPGHFRGKGNFEEWEDILLPEYKKKADEDLLSPWRTLIFGLIFLFTFFGIFLRLFHLQVISGKEARVRADENRVALKVVHAPRGVIYDREGRVLAESNPGFRLGEKIITRDEALNLESRNDPTFEQIEIDAIRFYPQGESVAHIVGYVGEIQESELKNSKVYKKGDRIGRAGIEQTYEDVLRGKDGAEIIEIDASGKKIGTIRRVEPVPGQNVILSIDAFLQKQVFETLKKGTEKASSCCSAAAAIDPKNSQVLALASYPSYNNNDFTDPEKNDNTTAYLADSNSPLLNRAIAGQYPPGSTFKIVTALAGLTSGKINKDTEVEDTGVMSLGQWSFPNWYFLQYGRKEGMVNLVKALQRSNDIYFYKVGQMLGEKLLGEEAAKKAKKCYIIRTAWVYGDGHNFVKTMLRLSETMPEIKVVNDQIGKPAWADDLAKAMIGVIEKNLPQGVYHFTNDGDEISWADFARKIFELAGKGTTVPNITTEEYIAMNSNKKIAPRPHYSVLDLSKLKNAGVSVPNWEESLKSYLELG